MRNEKEISAPASERPMKRRRRRKKEFTDATYGARLPPEEARIADDYALRHGLERADVVRLAMKDFAYKQGLRYPLKSEIAETREKIFREHFAAVAEQLDALLAAVRGLPETLLELFDGRLFRAGDARIGDGPLLTQGDATGEDFAGRVEAELRSQRETLQQAHFSSVLALRLITNYLVEPQIRSITAADADALKPHLRAAREGNEAWGVVLSAVMKLTGDRAMAELGYPLPDEKSGTGSAADESEDDDATDHSSELTDEEMEEVL